MIYYLCLLNADVIEWELFVDEIYDFKKSNPRDSLITNDKEAAKIFYLWD